MESQNTPLAVRLRPQNLDDFIGQEHVLGPGKLLRRAIASKRIPSLILWGPAGCGKTSLGFIVAKTLEADFEYLNAAFSSVAKVKKIIETARKKIKESGKKTIIFLDEIHRFNKLQQESLVPDTETTNIILIGTTIYNPHYYLISSLISRSIIAQFNPLPKEKIAIILKKALKNKTQGLGSLNIQITNKALEYIAISCAGDARGALTALEIGAFSTTADMEGRIVIDLEVAKESIQKRSFYDKKNTYHYDTISAFIKSIRGSDVDNALYWLAKMLKSGEDPRFIARRMIILASEDIGNAEPFALVLATNCFKAVEMIGMPEAKLILAQVVVYLATCHKSNSSYLAINSAFEYVENEETKEVPSHLKKGSKEYKYPHDSGGYVAQDYGVSRKYYFPKTAGYENRIKEFLESIKA